MPEHPLDPPGRRAAIVADNQGRFFLTALVDFAVDWSGDYTASSWRVTFPG
jgi:hypothetical protein